MSLSLLGWRILHSRGICYPGMAFLPADNYIYYLVVIDQILVLPLRLLESKGFLIGLVTQGLGQHMQISRSCSNQLSWSWSFRARALFFSHFLLATYVGDLNSPTHADRSLI